MAGTVTDKDCKHGSGGSIRIFGIAFLLEDDVAALAVLWGSDNVEDDVVAFVLAERKEIVDVASPLRPRLALFVGRFRPVLTADA